MTLYQKELERFGTDIEDVKDHKTPDKLAIEMHELVGAHNAVERLGTDMVAVAVLLARFFMTFVQKVVERLGIDIGEFTCAHNTVDKLGTDRLAVSVLLTRLFMTFAQTLPDKLVTDIDELAEAHKAFDRFGTDRLAAALLLTRLFITLDHTKPERLGTDIQEFVADHMRPDKFAIDIEEFDVAHRAAERLGTENPAVLLVLIRLFTTLDQIRFERLSRDMEELADHNSPDKLTIEIEEFDVAHKAAERFGTERLAVVLVLTTLFMRLDHTAVERFGTERLALT